MLTNIVQVQFKNRYGEGYGGMNYTYIADVPVSVGDIVKVPTRYGESEAKVCRVNVPENEIPSFCGELLHITSPATPGDLFNGFFN